MSDATWVCRHCGSVDFQEVGTIPATLRVTVIVLTADGQPVNGESGEDVEFAQNGFASDFVECLDCFAREDDLADLVIPAIDAKRDCPDWCDLPARHPGGCVAAHEREPRP